MSVDITSVVIKAESVGITQAAKALDGLAASAAVVEKGVTALSAAMTKLNTLNMSSSAAAESYMSKLREQAAIMQALNASAKGAAGGTEALAAAMALLAASLNLINNRLQENVIRQRASNESMREAHALARGLAGSFNALWTTYGNFAGMAVGLAIGASLKGIVVLGKDVEHTLEGIRVRGEESVKSIDAMREAVYELGKGVYGPVEIAKAFETLTLAGLKAEQSLLAIKDALNLATVGGTSIGKAAEALVGVGTALGYTAEGYSRIADVIAKTAAVSIASVESISESFKAASAVGKLYGVTLVDLGVQVAALSNLLVRGSAAGTAIKNFYSVLSNESEKVTRGLKMLNLTLSDLRTPDGQFKSFTEIMLKLRGETTNATSGFNSLDAAAQKTAQKLLTNERSNRLFTESLSLIRQEGTKTATALEDLFKNIDESYGYAALGAAAMALTVNSQLKSVKNTLEVVFVKAFREIQPEISLVATALKQAFNSGEFNSGIKSIARAVADFTVFLIDNASAIWDAVRALIAFKAAAAVLGVLMAFAEGMIAITTAVKSMTLALGLARGAAIAFQLSLGLVGVALVAGAALFALWATARAEATTSDQARASLNYLDDFKGKLDEETERMRKQIKLMEDGKNANEAYTQSLKDQQLDLIRIQSTKAIFAQRDILDAAKKELADKPFMTVRTPEGEVPTLTPNLDAVKKVAAAQTEFNRVVEATKEKVKGVTESMSAQVTEAKKLSDLADKQAKDSRKFQVGEGTAPPKPDKGAINDAYATAIEEINGRIKKTKKDLQYFEEQQNNLFKAGEIGRLEVIRTTSEKEIEEYTKRAVEIQKQIDIASGGKNKKADVARFSNALSEVQDALAASRIRTAQEEGVALVKVEEETTKSKIKELETQGKYVQAAMLQFGSTQGAAMMQAQKDAEKYGDEFPLLVERVRQFTATQATMVQDARVKEATVEFDNLYKTISNGIKGVQTATENDGLGEMLMAAMKASEEYKASLPSLEEALKKVKEAAKGGSPEAQGKYEEELTKQKNLAEKYRTMWAGVGESVSKSLGSAFGNGGKALGSLITQFSKFNELDKQTASQRVKSYGDMAGAAKGFFKEGSTGYKVLETAEKAFRVVELLGMSKSLQAVVVNAAAKAAAYIPAVLMSFMASMGPWGLAAAGVAIASVLGGAFSGGGNAPTSAAERQKTQGTGSVFGDSSAKSESIAKSLEAIQKDSGLGLVNSNSMVVSLKQIVSGIGGLGGVLNRGGLTGKVIDEASGGFFSKLGSSIFGGKTTTQDLGFTIDKTTVGGAQSGVNSSQYIDTKTSGGWFSSDKYKTQVSALGKVADDQFTMIIKGLADTITSAANTLGIGGTAFTDKLSSFVIDIGKISLKGLTGEEQQKALEAVFSKLGDDMAGFAVAGLADFRKVGEGYLETLVRVTNEVVQVNDVFSVLGKSFTATGIEAIKLSQDLINASGDVETLTKNTKFFVDNLLSESEKMAPVTESLNKRFTELNLSTSMSSDEFKNLILAQDLTTAGGQNLYSALIALAPAFKETTDFANDMAKKQRELDIELMKARGNSAEALAAEREDEIKALMKLSPALAETKKMIYQLEDAASALALKQTSLGMQLTIATATQDTSGIASIVSQQREIELKALDASLRPLQERINTLKDEASALALLKTSLSMSLEIANAEKNNSKVAEIVAKQRRIELDALDASLRPLQERINALKDEAAEIDRLKSVASGAYAELAKSVEAEKAAAQKTYDTEIARLDLLKTSSKESYDASKMASDAAKDTAKTLVTTLSDLFSALDSALNSLLEDSGLGMKREQGMSIINQALEQAKRTGVLPTADDIKMALGTVSKINTSDYSSFNDYTKDAGTSARTLADLAGITKTQKTAAEKSLEALELNNVFTEEMYNLQQKEYDQAILRAKALLDSENKRFESTIAVAKEQLDIMNGTYVAIVSMKIAIDNFNSSVLNAIAEQRKASISNGSSSADSTSAWQAIVDANAMALKNSNQSDYTSIDGSHASGLDNVPRDNYIAKLHRGEKVMTASDAKAYREDMTMKDVIQAINEMKDDNSAENQAMNSQLVLMRKIFQNITPNGTSLNVNTVTVP